MRLLLPLACVLVLILPDSSGTSPVSSAWCLLILLLCVLVPMLVIAGLGGWTAAALRPSSPQDRSRQSGVIRRYHRLRSAWVYLACACFAAATHLGGWAAFVRNNLGLGRWPFLDELVIVLPWLPVVLVGLHSDAVLDERIRDRLWMPHSNEPGHGPESAWREFWREYGLWIQAGAFALAARDLGEFAWPELNSNLVAGTVFLAVVLLLGLTLLPAMILGSWNLQRLPDGRLRSDFKRSARAWRVRPPALYLWKPPNAAANAMATGLLPGVQVVLLSESLLNALPHEDLIAVFGHELGHLRHRHILRYWLLSISALAMAVSASALVEPWLKNASTRGLGGVLASAFQFAPLSICLGMPILLAALAFFKRRFERQADVAGCRIASWAESPDRPNTTPSLPVTPQGVRRFRQALEHVAQLNGLEVWDRSWFAPSLGERFAFLVRLEVDPGVSDDFDKATSWMVNSTAAVLLLATILLAAMAD